MCVGLGYVIQPEQERLTVIAMSFSATVVLIFWSMYLSVRALRANEQAHWPVAVLALGLLEITVGSALLFGAFYRVELKQWAWRYGIPVFAAVFAIAAIMAAFIAFWRVRRAERRVGSACCTAWDRGRRWKLGLAWFFPLATILTALFLPAPLFLYAVAEQQFVWREFVIANTPEIVADFTAQFFADPKGNCIYLYGAILASGRVSPERLKAELSSTNSHLRSQALYGLKKIDRIELLFNRWLEDPVDARVDELMYAIRFIDDGRMGMLFAALQHTRPYVRLSALKLLLSLHGNLQAYENREILRHFFFGRQYYAPKGLLLSLLDDPDLPVRREATIIAHAVMNKPSPRSFTTSFESEEEKNEREETREKLKKWIAERR